MDVNFIIIKAEIREVYEELSRLRELLKERDEILTD
jgi:hypothetical protein